MHGDTNYRYQLPPWCHEGKPLERYSPKSSKNIKYLIVDFFSTSTCLMLFRFCESNVSIPIRVQEALNDSKWVESITTEMRALENRSQIWDVMTLPDGKKHVLYKLIGVHGKV